MDLSRSILKNFANTVSSSEKSDKQMFARGTAKIIGEEKAIQDARLYLTYATGLVLKIGAGILGIEMPEKM